MKHPIARKLHLWLSIPLGLLISLICVTGALLVFERDLSRGWQAGIDPAGRQPLPIPVILGNASAHVPTGSHIAGLTVYPDSTVAYKVLLSKPPMAALWVDQYSGEVMGKYKRPAIFRISSTAHRRLFGDNRSEWGNIGKMIVGVTTICVIVIVVTGFILWWPADMKSLRRHLSIPFCHGFHAFCHGLHCAGGVYAGILLLLCALTGLTWSFKWYRTGVYSLFGTSAPAPSRMNGKAVNFDAWQTAFTEVARKNPGKEIRAYQGKIEVVKGTTGNAQAVEIYKFDADTGRITSFVPYSATPESRKIRGWISALHLGSWGGMWSKIIYFLLALLAASLPLTGYYLWIRRCVRRKQ